jgi:hypothetical protein
LINGEDKHLGLQYILVESQAQEFENLTSLREQSEQRVNRVTGRLAASSKWSGIETLTKQMGQCLLCLGVFVPTWTGELNGLVQYFRHRYNNPPSQQSIPNIELFQ